MPEMFLLSDTGVQQMCITGWLSDNTLVRLNNVLDNLNSARGSLNGVFVSLFMFSFPKWQCKIIILKKVPGCSLHLLHSR